MRPPAAIIESVFESSLREINALEQRIVHHEDEADALLWEQARQVVAQLDAGLSQRPLAAQWINVRTGEPYSQMHVSFTARVYREKFTFQPRPRFRDAYNEIANAGVSGKVNRLVHQTGDTEWYSPPDIVDAARDVLGRIDLDPASCPAANTVVQATTFYTAETNGLEHPWPGHVFLNPPYRQPDIQQFSEKFAQEVTAGRTQAAIVLVNNATDTQWFETLSSVATAFCFLWGRCRYWQPDRETSTALQGQVVVYAGPDRAAFTERFAALGLVLGRLDAGAIVREYPLARVVDPDDDLPF